MKKIKIPFLNYRGEYEGMASFNVHDPEYRVGSIIEAVEEQRKWVVTEMHSDSEKYKKSKEWSQNEI